MRLPIRAVTPETGSAEIVGWVHEIRDLGGLSFFLIRDRTGIIQVTMPKKNVPAEILEVARNVSRESVVRVRGRVKAIDKAPGGREIVPEELEIINLAESPLPLDVVEKVPADMDTRLDSRFLDARKPRVRAIFFIRSAVICAATEFLSSRGCINITTPKIRRGSYGGRHRTLPDRLL